MFAHHPLSERLRPSQIDDLVGQDHLMKESGLINQLLKQNKLISLLFWGPPGSGKTTLAKLYAKHFDADVISFSAVSNKIAELKKALADREALPLFSRPLIVFVDEIHRLNQVAQDLFLPYLENGSLVLIGATTENPSFAINDALLSRLRVLPFQSLSDEALGQILLRYERKYAPLPITEKGREVLIHAAAGDGRYLLNLVENIRDSKELLDETTLLPWIQKRSATFDKKGEGHYNLISALHKSVRGSDPDAALYWLCRLFEAGESRQFIARRIIRMAVEDIGLADPKALEIALESYRAYDQLGSPEGELALAQAIVYLALSPKSNALYLAYEKCKEIAAQTGHLSPPKIILNAPTQLMKEQGYGAGYLYDHDEKGGCSGQNYFPQNLSRMDFYHPKEVGFEREMKKRIDYFKSFRKEEN